MIKRHNRRNLTSSVGASLLAVGLAYGSAAQASITFEYDFSGNTAGVGFLDPTYGAQRRDALTDAGNRFSAMFSSYFSNSATIKLSITSSDSPTSSTLASAGSWMGAPGGSGFTVFEVIKTKLQTGVDKNGTTADGLVNVNWGKAWDIDPNVKSTTQFDFYSVLNHEYTHALGFASTIDFDGTDLWGKGQTSPGRWNTFDQFVTDASGKAVIDHSSFLINQATWDAAKDGGSSLFFNGPNAMAANGGNKVGLYSPTTWRDGSSGSHLDTQSPTYDNMMMTHSIGKGIEKRTYSAVEVGIMTDLGYSRVAPVPEPETYALMLAGLGVIGVARRRRQSIS